MRQGDTGTGRHGEGEQRGRGDDDALSCFSPASPRPPVAASLHAVWLGRQSYDAAHDRQVELRELVAGGARPPTLLLVEHEPVVTVGRRGELNDLLVTQETLEQSGIAFRHAERGGRATYHGPGQLVGYLVGPLRVLAPDVCAYVCRLEDALLATSSALGVEASRHEGQPGIWVGDAKLGSIGVAISRGICWHGFALNLDVDLAAFDVIRPCGLDLPVTSIADCGGRRISVQDCGRIASDQVANAFGLNLTEDPR